MKFDEDAATGGRSSMYWDHRFGTGDTPWELNAPSAVLLEALAHLYPGQEQPLQGLRVLSPGCGTGSDAVELAKLGGRVLAVDWSERACNRLRAKIAARKPQDGEIEIQVLHADFFATPPEAIDLVCEHTFFCAIDPLMRCDYVAAVSRWLKPGGYLVGNFFVLDEAQCRELPSLSLARDGSGPPFATSVEALSQLFSENFDLVTLRPAKAGEGSRRPGLEWVGILRRR